MKTISIDHVTRLVLAPLCQLTLLFRPPSLEDTKKSQRKIQKRIMHFFSAPAFRFLKISIQYPGFCTHTPDMISWCCCGMATDTHQQHAWKWLRCQECWQYLVCNSATFQVVKVHSHGQLYPALVCNAIACPDICKNAVTILR